MWKEVGIWTVPATGRWHSGSIEAAKLLWREVLLRLDKLNAPGLGHDTEVLEHQGQGQVVPET